MCLDLGGLFLRLQPIDLLYIGNLSRLFQIDIDRAMARCTSKPQRLCNRHHSRLRRPRPRIIRTRLSRHHTRNNQCWGDTLVPLVIRSRLRIFRLTVMLTDIACGNEYACMTASSP